MKRFVFVATIVGALLVALPGVAAADLMKNTLDVTLTCGGETFQGVVPAGGRSAPALFVGSTSVAVLKGVEGLFFVPGFTADELTRCTAMVPATGQTFTAFVLITPRR